MRDRINCTVPQSPVKQQLFMSRLIGIRRDRAQAGSKNCLIWDLCQTQTLCDPALPDHRGREPVHISHNPCASQTRPLSQHSTCGLPYNFVLFQDSAVSRRVWPWTGSRGSWVSCRTPAWGKCPQGGPHTVILESMSSVIL